VERINYIIADKYHDKLTIYQCLNGNGEWKDNCEQSISQLKQSINKGIWTCINDIEDVLVLIELLYDWLDDSVNFIIGTVSLIYIFKNNFEKELHSMIANYKQYTLETRKLIIDKFKNELKMSEFECLSCVAYFVSHLLLDDFDDLTLVNEFNLVLDKIAIYLLGYNIDLVYDNSDEFDAHKNKKYVNQLKNMIYIFAIVCKYDWKESGKRKGSLGLMSNYLRRTYSVSDENEIISIHRSNPNLLTRLKTQKNLEESFKNEFNKKDYLFKVFNKLKGYFEHGDENGNAQEKEKFEEFFIGFMDFIEAAKKSNYQSPLESPKSNKSILKVNTTVVHDGLARNDGTSFALLLKKGDSDEDSEKSMNLYSAESKAKNLRFDSHKDIISYINVIGCSSHHSKNSNYNERPKARRRIKYNSTRKDLPEMYNLAKPNYDLVIRKDNVHKHNIICSEMGKDFK
jgi:hypothetical protein